MANAVLPFAVLQILALILTELELHLHALLLPGLLSLLSPLPNAPMLVALKQTAVFHCVVPILNATLDTGQDRIPARLLAQVALALMMFAAQGLCVHRTINALVLSMC
jgi:hypothetical protein